MANLYAHLHSGLVPFIPEFNWSHDTWWICPEHSTNPWAGSSDVPALI